MSHHAIEFDRRKNRFVFDGIPIRIGRLGELFAQAVVQSAGYIDFADKPCISFDGYPSNWTTAVSVEYVQEMLRFVGQHGWFWDSLSADADHVFDNQRPTPGCNWGQAKALFDEAARLFLQAKQLSREAQSRLASPCERRAWNRQARQLRGKARNCQRQAWYGMHPGVSRPPSAFRR